MTDALLDTLSTALFAAAVAHTLTAPVFRRLEQRFAKGGLVAGCCHLLSEVEVVFALWAMLLVLLWSFCRGSGAAAGLLQQVDFTEPVFVFVVMALAATRPVLTTARWLIAQAARCLPLPAPVALYLATMTLGPLLGSLITEPAAMTVTALLLRADLLTHRSSRRLRYASLGLLFVNISIGGTLTHFAAPPVLLVAGPFGWTTPFMLAVFGWRAALAVVTCAVATTLVFRRELSAVNLGATRPIQAVPAWWVSAVQLGLLALVVCYSHQMAVFIPVALLALAWMVVTKADQEPLRLRESLLVAVFLAGLLFLGHLQSWWLEPVVASLGERTLFWGAAALTSLTDNAAITYLGTLVPELSAQGRVALVSGAVVGGGLTVIANAPNPAGYAILSPVFGEEGISAFGLLLGALPYTLLAAAVFNCL